MTNWMAWLAVAAVMVALEMFLGTFYLLMIALGLGCGAVAAVLGAAPEWQIVAAGVSGVLATAALRHRRSGHGIKAAAQADPNVNQDIGQVVVVEHWHSAQGALQSASQATSRPASTARVMYRGALWDIDLAPGQAAVPGRYLIREVHGNRFLVVAA